MWGKLSLALRQVTWAILNNTIQYIEWQSQFPRELSQQTLYHMCVPYLSTFRVKPIRAHLFSTQICANTWARYLVSMRSSVCWASYEAENNRISGNTNTNSSTMSSACKLLQCSAPIYRPGEKEPQWHNSEGKRKRKSLKICEIRGLRLINICVAAKLAVQNWFRGESCIFSYMTWCLNCGQCFSVIVKEENLLDSCQSILLRKGYTVVLTQRSHQQAIPWCSQRKNSPEQPFSVLLQLLSEHSGQHKLSQLQLNPDPESCSWTQVQTLSLQHRERTCHSSWYCTEYILNKKYCKLPPVILSTL